VAAAVMNGCQKAPLIKCQTANAILLENASRKKLLFIPAQNAIFSGKGLNSLYVAFNYGFGVQRKRSKFVAKLFKVEAKMICLDFDCFYNL